MNVAFVIVILKMIVNKIVLMNGVVLQLKMRVAFVILILTMIT